LGNLALPFSVIEVLALDSSVLGSRFKLLKVAAQLLEQNLFFLV
jgi:hypothetical protein